MQKVKKKEMVQQLLREERMTHVVGCYSEKLSWYCCYCFMNQKGEKRYESEETDVNLLLQTFLRMKMAKKVLPF